jgi:hypothetical protein
MSGRKGRGLLTVPVLLICLSTCSTDNSTQPNRNVDNTEFEASQPFTIHLDADGRTGLQVDAVNGDISIDGRLDSDSVFIEGEKIVRSESRADAEEHLEFLDVISRSQGVEIVVETVQPEETYGRGYIVNYEIDVPRDFEVAVDEVNGRVAVHALANDVVVQLVNGEIALSQIVGSVTARLANGRIESGISLPPNGVISLIAVNGDICLSIPKTTSAEFSASVENGTIAVSNLDIQDQHSTPSSLHGVLGSGQGTIALSVVNGNIGVSGF